jgi:hypothetical protein
VHPLDCPLRAERLAGQRGADVRSPHSLHRLRHCRRRCPAALEGAAAAKDAAWGAMADLTDTQCAVLLMLATAPRGYSLPTVMARGFAYEMIQDVVRIGLASVGRDAVGTEKRKLAHLRITVAGRKAIAD